MFIRTIDIWKVVKGLFKSIDGGNEFSLNLFYCTFRNREDPFFPLVLLTPDPDATAEKIILRRHWSRRLVGGVGVEARYIAWCEKSSVVSVGSSATLSMHSSDTNETYINCLNCILFSLGILRVHIKEQSSSAKSQLSFKTATGWHEWVEGVLEYFCITITKYTYLK